MPLLSAPPVPVVLSALHVIGEVSAKYLAELEGAISEPFAVVLLNKMSNQFDFQPSACLMTCRWL